MPEYRARLEIRNSGDFQRFSINARSVPEVVRKAQKSGAQIVWVKRLRP